MRSGEYKDFERELCLALDGVFAFALVHGEEFMVARDPIGVKALYWGTDHEGRKLFRLSGEMPMVKFHQMPVPLPHFSSEMKVIEDICYEVFAFPPGHFFTPKRGLVRYYEVKFLSIDIEIDLKR